jgi:hypothetical protein
MANGTTKREPWEPKNREEEVIDPKDPDAARKFVIQKRGGQFSDRARIDPDSAMRRMANRRRSVRT